MKSEDNSFKNIDSMTSISNNDLITDENLTSRKIINAKDIRHVSYYNKYQINFIS